LPVHSAAAVLLPLAATLRRVCCAGGMGAVEDRAVASTATPGRVVVTAARQANRAGTLLAVAIHADQAVRQIVTPRREAGMVNQVSRVEKACRVTAPAVAVMVTAAR